MVSSLVDRDKVMSRFLFATADGQIKLSLYPNKYLKSWQLKPGAKWQLPVKLKSSQGFANPGVFNYHHWLKRQGTEASGYVLNKPEAEYLGRSY